MESATTLKEKGNKEFLSNNFAKAVDCYTQAIDLQKDPVFYANRAACYLSLKKYHAAIEDCKLAIELDEKSVKPYYRLAQAYSSLGDLKTAFDTLKSGCEKHPQELNMRREYDNVQILMSYKDGLERMLEDLQFAEALKKVSTLLEKCEMDFEILVKKIELLCKTNEPKLALNLLGEREVFINSRSQTKCIALNAMIERYMNKIEESKKRLQNGLRLDPDNSELRNELKHLLAMESAKSKGNVAFSQRKFDEAIISYDDCFLLDPYNAMWKAVILSNKASCYMGMKDTPTALDLMKRSTVFDPNNAKNMYKRGKLEKDLKEWESALICMKKAKSMDSTLTIDADIKQISEELKKQNDKNYYEIMGLKKNATPEEIKATYKVLVRKYHPDRHSANSEEQQKAEKIFKDVNEANEVLSDPKKKQQYDLGGCKKLSEQESNSGFQHGFGGVDASELFGMFFSNSNSQGGRFSFSQQGAGGAGRQNRKSQGNPFFFQ